MADNSENKLFGTVAVGVVGIIGVALIIKLIRDARKMSSGKRVTTDENVRIAMELNSAIYPGRSFISNIFVTPNIDEIFRLGGYIENFEDISVEYRNLYQESLSLDLQDALGSDYPDFINMLKKVESGTNIFSDFEAQQLAKKLNDEMIGLNWFGRNEKPFNDLLRLTDNNFRKVIEIYNQKYEEDFKTTFDGEYSIPVVGSIFLYQSDGWIEIIRKITKRYDMIF